MTSSHDGPEGASGSGPGDLGIVSDTHGLLRPGVLPLLQGVEQIIHAGDVGGAGILESLRAIAPVTAVRGNTDRDPFGRTLPMTEVVEYQGHSIYLLHILEDLDLDPVAAGMSAVVYGHTHRPQVDDRDGVLFINPGSCGPRRFSLPVTVARLSVTDHGLEVRLLPVQVDDGGAP